MATEYRDDFDKHRLLRQTVDAVCNNLDVNLNQVRYSTRQYFRTPAFQEFKRQMVQAKDTNSIDRKREIARQALPHWDWTVQTQYSRLPHYVTLLRAILDLFDDAVTKDWVWIREADSASIRAALRTPPPPKPTIRPYWWEHKPAAHLDLLLQQLHSLQ